ncbi:MAG: response regulator transcription factor [Chloroflexota bacterium]
MRQGLRQVLESHKGFSVVGEAQDGQEALKLVEDLQPDVAILDLAMPGLNGLEIARRIRQRWPTIQMLVLSMHNSEAYVWEAMSEGILGYVLKETATKDLVHAVEAVAAGKQYLSAPLTPEGIQAYGDRMVSSSLDPYVALTDREREVLHLLAEGQNRNIIAAKLSISTRTVDTHRTNLMRKLNLGNQAEMIMFAVKRGIITRSE